MKTNQLIRTDLSVLPLLSHILRVTKSKPYPQNMHNTLGGNHSNEVRVSDNKAQTQFTRWVHGL